GRPRRQRHHRRLSPQRTPEVNRLTFMAAYEKSLVRGHRCLCGRRSAVSACDSDWTGSDDRGPDAAWNADNIHYVKYTVRAALPASATQHGTHVTPQRRSRSTVSEPEGARRLASASSGHRLPHSADHRAQHPAIQAST